MKQTLFNRNEVLQGPSPRVITALKNFKREHIYLYLDSYYGSLLIPAIAHHVGILEEHIMIFYGEEDFFELFLIDSLPIVIRFLRISITMRITKSTWVAKRSTFDIQDGSKK